jgi:hypothetical protein
MTKEKEIPEPATAHQTEAGTGTTAIPEGIPIIIQVAVPEAIPAPHRLPDRAAGRHVKGPGRYAWPCSRPEHEYFLDERLTFR